MNNEEMFLHGQLHRIPVMGSLNSRDFMAKSLNIYFPDIGLAVHRGFEAQKILMHALYDPVLDLGCGDGKFTSLWSGFLANPPEVLGCDIAAERINEAIRYGRLRHAVAVEGSSLPFGDGSFGTVIANSVLTHIPEIDQIMAEVSRILKSGGYFFATVPGPDFENQLATVRLLKGIGLHWPALKAGDRYHIRWQQIHRDGEDVWKRRFGAYGLSLAHMYLYPGRRAGLMWSLSFYGMRIGYGRFTLLNIVGKLLSVINPKRKAPDNLSGILASYLAPLLDEPGTEGGSLFLVGKKEHSNCEMKDKPDDRSLRIASGSKHPDRDAIRNWLINSPIRVRSEAPIMEGGYGNLIDSRTGKCALLYCEITGYAAQFWLRQRNPESLNLAIAAGDCLLRIQALQGRGMEKDAFPYGLIRPDGAMIPAYFSFDAGICASAFIDLALETGEARFAEGARRSGDFLIRMQTEDGSFKAMYTSQPDHFGIPQIESWFGDHCVLHGKIAIALLKLWKLTGESKWKEAACRLLDWVCKIQGIRGDFPQWHGSPLSMSHTHCYATEGLLYAGLLMKHERYLSAGIRGAEWLRMAQQRSGGLCTDYKTGEYDLPDPAQRSILHIGPVAQAIRIWWVAETVSLGRQWMNAASRALSFLFRIQSPSNQPFIGGAFPQSVRVFGSFIKRYPYYSSWEAMFAYEAIRLWTEGDDEPVWSIF